MRKTLLITGASRGIGAATALLAGKRGYNICVNYLSNSEAASQIVNQIKTDGGHAVAYQADVSKEAEVLSLFQKIDQDFGPINALVNNAGILETQSRVDQMDLERLMLIFNKKPSCVPERPSSACQHAMVAVVGLL